MSKLAPDLFTRRFSDFMDIGRARLHALAPEWTDYNAHDPGITLMELLAWTSEAQLYSLSRMRRDERTAYAALLGIQPSGTQPATGLIWPDSQDLASPVATYTASTVLPKYSAVTLADTPGPVYRTLQDLLWVPGAIQSLVTRQGNTPPVYYTSKNKRGKLVFYPFGQGSAIGTTLSLSFHCRDARGLFGTADHSAQWPIGVLASPAATETGAGTGADLSAHPGSRLSAALIAGGERFPLTIVADASQSMLTTGVILLGLSNVPISPVDFVIEFTAPQDLIRPPRVLRIEANVLPIEQSQSVDSEKHTSNGMPGWSFTLEKTGVKFTSGSAPVVIQTREPAQVDWECDDLSELGADNSAFEFDPDTGTVTFGNGINGRVPAAESEVFASYQFSDGAAGNIARNRTWNVKGFQGAYGKNLNPLSGGANATDLLDLKRSSRQLVQKEHPLITSPDIVDAACALPLLEVGRAWPLAPSATTRTGTVTLVAMRQRPGGVEPTLPPETPLWLRSIQQLLRPRMTLGSRLRVIAPQYVSFTINAVLEVVRGVDPEKVKNDVTEVLRKRFQLVPSSSTAQVVKPGVPVSPRDISGWIRGVEGINRIVTLTLMTSAGAVDGALVVPANGLAKLEVENSQINVVRPGASGGAA